MAIVCKEAAKTFIENMDGFEIVGDCVLNSDIFIINPEIKDIKLVAMTQDREYQKNLIRKRFDGDVEIVELMATALPYSLLNGNVDAIVMDLIKGIHVEGLKEETSLDEDYSSYVLIVRSNYKNTRDYRTFIKAYNGALGELLEDEDVMKKQFFDYTRLELGEGGLDKWRTRLLYLKED